MFGNKKSDTNNTNNKKQRPRKKRRLKKEASMVIGGIIIFMIFVIVSIIIKKNLEITMEKKISSPVITVDDNIVTLKDFSYYIINIEKKGDEMARAYDANKPIAYWNLYMNDATESGYITDIARRTAIEFCVRDNIYALEAAKAGVSLTEEEMDEIKYDAEQFYYTVSVKGRNNTHIDVLSIEKAMRTEKLAYKYIMQLAQADEEGVLQSVVLKYDVGGKYYESLKFDYNIKIENAILNEVKFGFVSIN